MSKLLGLAHLSALDLAPPKLVSTAAEVGFSSVGIRLVAVNDMTPGYPLMHQPQQLKETLSALRDTGIYVNDVEFIKFDPEIDVPALQPIIDAASELGARNIIVAPYDEDFSRLGANLAQFSEMAQQRGIRVALEFFPWTPVNDLQCCWDLVSQASDSLAILVDSLHFNRSHSSLELLKTIPADRLPFAQLCDAPVQPSYTFDELIYAGRDERLAPGSGEIPLTEIVNALPAGTPISLEVPQLKKTAELGEKAVLTELFKNSQQFFERL
jgi:sugar phosphate isomerase/epimerase